MLNHLPAELDPRRLAPLPTGIALVLLFGGGMAAAAAMLLPPGLMRALPVLANTGINTMLAFALLGAGFLAFRHPRRSLRDVFALLVLALAAVTLLCLAFGIVVADGPWRVLINTRVDPLEGSWLGRMSAPTALGLALAAVCLLTLTRVRGLRCTVVWLATLVASFLLGVIGLVAKGVGIALLVDPFQPASEMGPATALGLILAAIALFRMAATSKGIAEAFGGHPERTVFAATSVGLLTALLAGGIVAGGVMGRTGFAWHGRTLARSLDMHVEVANTQLQAFARVGARLQAELGKGEGAATPAALRERLQTLSLPVTVSVRLESAAHDAPGAEQGLRLRLPGGGESWVYYATEWRVTQRSILPQAPGLQLIVAMPVAALNEMEQELRYLDMGGEMVVCGPALRLAAEQCVATLETAGRPFPRTHAAQRKSEPTPMARALAGERGVRRTRDYRNRDSLVAFAPLGDSGLGIVQKVDLAGTQAELRRGLWLILGAMGLIALLAGALMRRYVQPLLRDLADTRQSLNRAQAVARVGSWNLHTPGDRLSWSDETYRMFGVPAGQPIDYRDFLDRVHPDDRERVDAAWAAAVAGAPYDIEHRIVVRGDTRWVRERAELEFDATGRLVAATGTVQDITEQKIAEAELYNSRQNLRELAAHHEQVREGERAHIAREIHDELGQHLTALRMDVAVMQMALGDERPELKQRAAAMKELIDDTIKVVRSVASDLRPKVLDLGLESAVEWLVGEFRSRSGLDCELALPGHPLDLDETRTTVVFRILQESLTNINRYAHATQVGIWIVQEGTELVLEIEDNGVGFDPVRVRAKKTFGLMGIRERAIMLGGSARFISAPGRGTLVRVRIPLAPNRHPGEAHLDTHPDRR